MIHGLITMSYFQMPFKFSKNKTANLNHPNSYFNLTKNHKLSFVRPSHHMLLLLFPPIAQQIMIIIYSQYVKFSLCTVIAYAVSTVAPPVARIFFSASLLKNLAFTTIGKGGKTPLPNTLK